MKFTTRLLAAVLAALSFNVVALAQEPVPAREQLERFSDGLETLQAQFSQVVLSADNEIQDRSEGEVWLRRPDRFRWAYGGDYPELVVADGERVWIYDEMLEQVTVREQDRAAMDSPLALLADPASLDESFEVREVGELDGVSLLELRSRSVESEFERFLLGLDDDRLVLIIMEDSFGLRTEIRFDAVQRNVEFDDVLFEFAPPEGVDVIGELPGMLQSR